MLLSDRPRVVYRDEASLVATWRTMAFTVMGPRPMSVAGAEGQIEACLALGRSVGRDRLIEIAILDAGVAFPSAEVRAALESGASRLGPYYAAVGTIFESRGFRALFIRGLLRSLQLASTAPFEQSVFAATRECAEWVTPIARRIGLPSFEPAELLEAISFTRGDGQRAGLLETPPMGSDRA